ncbi:hypothetical protein [Pelagerythrobacter rhizovicinus]|uniref:Uncharacterized protein n=1 Tax=Pelagerythrobacter rhizovicinus TaxID=2268576 RepID=A0A4Q2KT35_9SPHN|nr:hypothetical protein [Pelagerythrobacter rhizovicinus]RXZ66481.1 hypothetical protein ETX26_07325 [Pelagerythrobacter rhizovicinus]
MKTISKALVGTVAAGAMAMTSAAPAMARDYYDRDRGIDVGDVIAGAVIIGGIAALAGAFDGDDRYDRYDRRYRDRNYRGYNRGYSPRAAVERCVATAENHARRYGYRRADVTQIRDVDTNRDNIRVKGRIAVDGRYGYGRDRRYDTGNFTCRVDYRGRVYDLDYSGIRGL